MSSCQTTPDPVSAPGVLAVFIIGGKDMEAGNISVRLHHGGPQGAKPKAVVVAEILAKIRERKP